MLFLTLLEATAAVVVIIVVANAAQIFVNVVMVVILAFS